MICRRQHHLLFIGQDHRLQHVHHLRDVCHTHPIAVLLKNVQINAGGDRIAQSVLLIERTQVAAWLRVVPVTPFVDHQPHALLRIILVHNRAVLLNELVHSQRPRECRMPLFLVKLCR